MSRSRVPTADELDAIRSAKTGEKLALAVRRAIESATAAGLDPRVIRAIVWDVGDETI